MAELPNKLHLTSGLTTEAQFQSAIGDLYDVLAQLALIGPYEAIELDNTGAITPARCYIQIDNENLSASDNLNFIIPTNLGQKVIFLRNTSAARPTTLKHGISGTGKLNMLNGVDLVLSNPKQLVAFIWNDADSQWDELWRNFGIVLLGSYDAAAARTALSLGTAAIVNTGISAGQVPLSNQLGAAAFKAIGTSTNQVPTADLLGALAFLSQVTPAQMAASGVTPGTYGGLTINAQGIITAAVETNSSYNNYQAFTSNGTWSKPIGAPANAMVLIEAWGGGGSGSTHVSGTANNGGSSSFGTHVTAFGGGKGGAPQRGAGGGLRANADGGTNDTGGEGMPSRTQNVSPSGSFTIASQNGFYCGGPGEGHSVWGGGGGAGNGGGGGTQGLSTYGGNGGAWGQAGFAPAGGGSGHGYGWGGGGGAYRHRIMRLSELASTVAVTVGAGGAGYSVDTNGARGEVRVTIFG